MNLGRYTIQARDSKIARAGAVLRMELRGNRLCAGGAVSGDQEQLAGVDPVHVLDPGIGGCEAAPGMAGAQLRGGKFPKRIARLNPDCFL